jgi:hypothetical protein
VTNLANRVQPLIRLEVSDAVTLTRDVRLRTHAAAHRARRGTRRGRHLAARRRRAPVAVVPMQFSVVRRDRDVVEFQVLQEGARLVVLVVGARRGARLEERVRAGLASACGAGVPASRSTCARERARALGRRQARARVADRPALATACAARPNIRVGPPAGLGSGAMRRVPCIAARPGRPSSSSTRRCARPRQQLGLRAAAGHRAAGGRRARSPRCTLGVALLAVACAIPLGLADDSSLRRAHRRGAVVAAGGSLAVLAAAGRRRYEEALVNERAARRRSDFVGRAGQLLDAPPEPEAMLREIVRMAVPDMAELCIVDLVHDGALGETTAYATNPRTLEMLHASRTRYPLDPGGPHPVAVARARPPTCSRDRADAARLRVDETPEAMRRRTPSLRAADRRGGPSAC